MSDRPLDILYIHPAKQRVGFPFGDPRLSYLTPFTIMPVGIVGLINMLRAEGLEVRGVNYPAEGFIDPTFDLRAWLQGAGIPRAYLVDLHWYEHSFGALDVAALCKAISPRTPVVIGGLTASLFSREILERSPHVDYVLRGDAEAPLRELTGILCGGGTSGDLASIPNLSWRDGDHVVENERSYCASPADLDALDYASLDWLAHPGRYGGFQYVGRREQFIPADEPRYRAHWLCLGRGCVHNCDFCGGGSESHALIAGRRGFVLRSIGKVVDEMEALHSRGIHQIALTLDPAVIGEAYWQALLAEMSHRGLRVGLYNEAFQLPSDAFLEALAEVADLEHSQLALSLISGDEGVRRRNGKPFSNHELFERLRTLRRLKMPLAIYYSFNLPGQNEASLRRTLFVSQQIGRLYPARLLMMYNQPHTLDPCSPMSRSPDDHDLDIALNSFQDYYDYCRRTALEKPGVQGIDDRGFRWRGRTREEEHRMQALWTAFGRSQRFLCF
ncbi:MAG: radical SAM protein [Chloroflexi bacterium]|nr:radical SAM protein [Chloroflexota bacterium]